MTGGTVWCLGQYGSASTWLFNVVRQIYLALPGGQTQTHFFSLRHEFSNFAQPDVMDLVKSHEIEDEATALKLAARAEKIFITIRDPRDAVASLMQSHNHDFAKALNYTDAAASLCLGFMQDKRALILRYESGFYNELQTVHLAARHLSIELSDAEAKKIFAANRREQVEKYIAGLTDKPSVLRNSASGDLLDPETQWHSHHAARSGEAGRWRQTLTPAQIHEIETRMAYFSDAL